MVIFHSYVNLPEGIYWCMEYLHMGMGQNPADYILKNHMTGGRRIH